MVCLLKYLLSPYIFCYFYILRLSQLQSLCVFRYVLIPFDFCEKTIKLEHKVLLKIPHYFVTWLLVETMLRETHFFHGWILPLELIDWFPYIFNRVIMESKVIMFLSIFGNIWPSRLSRLRQFPVWRKVFRHPGKSSTDTMKKASIRPSSLNTKFSQSQDTNSCEMLLH